MRDTPTLALGAFLGVMRCANHVFGVLYDGAIRTRCKARDCGKGPGVVVFHYFHRETGVLLEVRDGPYRDPRGTLGTRSA